LMLCRPCMPLQPHPNNHLQCQPHSIKPGGS
jgi:hypothetical protein